MVQSYFYQANKIVYNILFLYKNKKKNNGEEDGDGKLYHILNLHQSIIRVFKIFSG